VQEADRTCSKHGDIRIEYRSCLGQNFGEVGKEKMIILKCGMYLKDKNFCESHK
jgi:hypothetical protein